MKNLKTVGLVFIALMLCITQFITEPIAANANSAQENVKIGINYMPPNPEAYSVIEQSDISNKIYHSSLSNTSLSKSKLTISKSPDLNSGSTEKILVIPIQFKDTPFSPTYNQEFFEKLLSGSENSLKDYYERNSGYFQNPNLGITVDVTVTDIVTSKYNMSYYGKDTTNGIDDANGNVSEMAREAINILDSENPDFDFSQFDTNKDEIIDHIIIIHAGDDQARVYDSANTMIWSHSSVIGTSGNYGQLVDDVYAFNYITLAETSPLGVFCHEFGHDLGLPDLYDADGSSNGYTLGVGSWDTMSNGSWTSLPGELAGSCPSNLSAWSKEYLGWVIPQDVTNNSGLQLINSDSNSSVYRLWPNGDKNSSEYFLVEYRRRIGYDAALPGEGVLVWHVDRQKTNLEAINRNEVNNNNLRLGVELEQADGQWNLWFPNNLGDNGDPFPGATENSYFIGAPYGIKVYQGEPLYQGNKVVPYDGNSLYGFNFSNIVPDKSTNVELRNINVNGTKATMDCSVIASSSSKPTLMSPCDMAVVAKNTVFSWGVTSDTKYFALQIADNSDFHNGYQIKVDRVNGIHYLGDKFFWILNEELENGKTYYWRIAGANDSDIGMWSDARSFTITAAEGAVVPTVPTNFNFSTSGSAITLNWDASQDATGYYILADGVENYSDTNMFKHTGLSANSRHEYLVRAVNVNSTSAWGEPQYIKTMGEPEILVDASGIIEGAEDGGTILVELKNGVFKTGEDSFNRATVSIDPQSLPAGTRQGNVTRLDDTHLKIGLVGNSTVDYDNDLPITIIVAKELISTGRYYDTYGSADLTAIVEPKPDFIPETDFNFSGENAARLMGATTIMEFSLDGGATYFKVTQNDMVLTPAQISSISDIKDIRVRIKGLRTPAGDDQIIDILPGPAAPKVTGDNSTNTVSGIDDTMEFSTDGLNWTKYSGKLPDLKGNVVLRVRIPAVEKTNAGKETVLTFTSESESSGGGGAFPMLPPVMPGSTSVVTDNKITITGIVADKAATSKLEEEDLKKALEKATASKDGVKTVVVELKEVKDADEYILEVPASKVSSTTKDLTFEVVTTFGTLELSNNILKPEEVKSAKNIAISITSADLSKLDNAMRQKIGNRPAIELEMKKDGKAFTWNNIEAPITISLNYRPTADELKDPDHIVVWYIDSKGNAQAVYNAKYDVKTNKVVFKVTHFSKYVVAYNNVTYKDLTKFKWAQNQVEVMAAKGIINDAAGGEFNPGQNITRGMLVDYIIKALGLTAAIDTNFSDVNANASYYESIAIAKKLGIISGVGQNKFNPDTDITRQEMMTILHKALMIADKVSTKANITDIANYKDTAKVSQYAIESTATMIKEGIISGMGNMTIDPIGKVTKAQAAVIAYKIYFK